VIAPDLAAEKYCECGHLKSSHRNSRGSCRARVQGYHMQDCKCSGFKTRTPQFERLQLVEGLLRESLELIEDMPNRSLNLDRTSLMARIRKAFGLAVF